jgi:predicted nucleic acid-binding protein
VIFVDSSFWIATRMTRDSHHLEAAELLGRNEGTPLTTSNHVIGETWTFLRRRVGHASASHFLDRLASTPRLRAEFVSEDLERDAWSWLRRHDERAYSFVDATSFALMRRLGIRDAFAFDGDFAAAGFNELRPE